MVLFVGPNEDNIRDLREWRRRADVVYLFNESWFPSLVIAWFVSTEPEDWRGLGMELEYATETARSVHYFYNFNHSPNFSLKVEVSLRAYYEYDSWCRNTVFLPDYTCSADNAYKFYRLDKLSLSYSESLYTIVPTQLSGFI